MKEYIQEYSSLTPQEHRQLFYKRMHKMQHHDWEDSMVLLVKTLKELLPTEAHVFDAGCGHGNYLIDEMLDLWGTRLGMDIGEEQTVGNTSVQGIIYGNLERIPIPDNSFDVVTSLWVFEHLRKPKNVMKEMHRILKPGGLLVFATPNKKSLQVRFKKHLPNKMAIRLIKRIYGREEQDVFPAYYRANTVGEIQRIAKQYPFEVKLLNTNSDPSYTSFNQKSYQISSFLSEFKMFHPHIVGILEKQA